MAERTNRQVRLRARPPAIPQAEHFELATARVPEPADGQLLVRNRFLSVDPAMRGWVSAVANYAKPVEIGEVMRSRGVGEVVASRHPDYAVGEHLRCVKKLSGNRVLHGDAGQLFYGLALVFDVLEIHGSNDVDSVCQ